MTVSPILKYKHHFYLLIRHGMVSVTCATTEFSLFMLMFVYLKSSLFLSYAVSFVTATLVGFAGHSFFTFKVGRLYKRNAIYFAVQASCAFILGYAIVSLLIHSGMHAAIAKGMQLVSIFFFNVLFGKFLSFKKISHF